MPELPEVESLTRSIRPLLQNRQISEAKFYRDDLRGPIPIQDIREILGQGPVLSVERRSKFMIWNTVAGSVIIHLGMTGNVVFKQFQKPDIKHTHAVFSIATASGPAGYLHYIDPRRFGWIVCSRAADTALHPLLAKLGPEPLEIESLGDHLYAASRKRQIAIKTFIMNAQIVVGVGNIYASEALHKARIHPERIAGTVSRRRFRDLGLAIRETLQASIEQGGTSFRDFKNSDGNPGYFKVALMVYGREAQPCHFCRKPIENIRLNGRATYFCPRCQS